MNILLISLCLALQQPVQHTQQSIDVLDSIVFMKDVSYATVERAGATTRQLLMDVAFPNAAEEPLPALVIVSGGRWCYDVKYAQSDTIRLFAQGGYFVVFIEYRLSSEANFPAAVHDCKAAIRFLRTSAAELNIDPTRIGILGISLAGGHLATLTGISHGVPLLDGSINGKDVSTEVVCVGSVSGALRPQFAKSDVLEGFASWALTRRDGKIEPALPETYLDASDPPIYLLCGEFDKDAPLPDAKAFATLLENKGIEYHLDIVKGGGKTSFSEPTAYVGLLNFLDKHLGGRCKEALEMQIKLRSPP